MNLEDTQELPLMADLRRTQEQRDTYRDHARVLMLICAGLLCALALMVRRVGTLESQPCPTAPVADVMQLAPRSESREMST